MYHSVYVKGKKICTETVPRTRLSHARLGVCEICGTCDAKYTCPRCEVKSCGLTCVQKHKYDQECSGIRDKTAYKPVSEFSSLDLLSDYRLLEDASRSLDSSLHNPLKYRTSYRKLPLHLQKLQQAAAARGTTVLFLPPCFSRRKTNTTYYDWKTKILQWRVEWCFPQADCIKYVEERLPENTVLSVLLDKFFSSEKCSPLVKLQYYQSASLSNMSLLLKAEHVRKSSSRFCLIDPSRTLKETLRNRTVIEFPSIYVVHNDHKHMYELVFSDEDNTTAEAGYPNQRYKHRFTSSRRCVKRAENLLFNNLDNSDGSDAETLL